MPYNSDVLDPNEYKPWEIWTGVAIAGTLMACIVYICIKKYCLSSDEEDDSNYQRLSDENHRDRMFSRDEEKEKPSRLSTRLLAESQEIKNGVDAQLNSGNDGRLSGTDVEEGSMTSGLLNNAH